MPTSTTNYGLIKPGTDDPILVGQLNDNMDTIDAALKENADAIENKPDAADIPTPSTAAPAMDGTAAAGTSTDYARADHIHPSDTSKQNALSSAQLDAVNSGITSEDVAQIETNKTNISNKNWNFRKIRYIATSAETWEKVESLYITIPPLKKAFITISAKYNNFEVTGVALSISDTFEYTNCIACEEPTNALNAVTASAVFENLANANATIVPYIKLSNSGGGGDDVWISYRLLDD